MNTFLVSALAHVAAHGRFGEFDSGLIKAALQERELVSPHKGAVKGVFQLTEKGRVMVNALVSVPEPVLAFTMPGKE